MKYLILLILFPFHLFAQKLSVITKAKKQIAPPDILWSKTFGGKNDDKLYWLELTKDKGLVMAGETNSSGMGDYDAWLIKTNSIGDTMWTRTYGGVGRDWAESVLELSDGGYIFAGGSKSLTKDSTDIYIVRTDKEGDTLWTRKYGDIGDQWAEEIRFTADGNFIIPGRTTSIGRNNEYDCIVIKIDLNGKLLWQKTYGRNGSNEAAKSIQSLNSGFVIAGYTWLKNKGDVWLIRTDENGDTLWTRTYGGDRFEMPSCIEKTRDSGFVMVGKTHSYGAKHGNILLMRTDFRGDTIWTRNFENNKYHVGTHVKQTIDDGFIIVGATVSVKGKINGWLVKTSAEGNIIWTKNFGGNSNDFLFSCVREFPNGDLIIIGYIGLEKSDGWVIKLKTR